MEAFPSSSLTFLIPEKTTLGTLGPRCLAWKPLACDIQTVHQGAQFLQGHGHWGTNLRVPSLCAFGWGCSCGTLPDGLVFPPNWSHSALSFQSAQPWGPLLPHNPDPSCICHTPFPKAGKGPWGALRTEKPRRSYFQLRKFWPAAQALFWFLMSFRIFSSYFQEKYNEGFIFPPILISFLCFLIIKVICDQYIGRYK